MGVLKVDLMKKEYLRAWEKNSQGGAEGRSWEEAVKCELRDPRQRGLLRGRLR